MQRKHWRYAGYVLFALVAFVLVAVISYNLHRIKEQVVEIDLGTIQLTVVHSTTPLEAELAFQLGVALAVRGEAGGLEYIEHARLLMPSDEHYVRAQKLAGEIYFQCFIPENTAFCRRAVAMLDNFNSRTARK